MGKTQAVHDRGFYNRCRVSVGSGLDSGYRGIVHEQAGYGQWENTSSLGLTDGPVQARSCTIALAVLSIYAVDFAINAGQRFLGLGFRAVLIEGAVQSSSRSLIVDTLPISKQQLGSAWGESSPSM